MKIMLKIWVILTVCWTSVMTQTHYGPEYLTQDAYYDSEEKSYYPGNSRHEEVRPYEPASHEEVRSYRPAPQEEIRAHQPVSHEKVRQHEPASHEETRPYEPASHRDLQSNDPSYYQSLDSGYHKREEEPYPRPPQHHVPIQPGHYQPPEETSYHRPQEIVYQHSPQEYQTHVPQHQKPYQRSPHHSHPEEDEPKYSQDPQKYSQASTIPHPAPVPTDPKLPLYFTMYEKRVVQDPMDKYGKGPWRYLTYGHGITYGSKEPGKVFEKGYGYIRALGRDHCKLPKHLCPPSDEKPFDYEGRKEPYFGYRPH